MLFARRCEERHAEAISYLDCFGVTAWHWRLGNWTSHGEPLVPPLSALHHCP